jgi:hypothetical protein
MLGRPAQFFAERVMPVFTCGVLLACTLSIAGILLKNGLSQSQQPTIDPFRTSNPQPIRPLSTRTPTKPSILSPTGTPLPVAPELDATKCVQIGEHFPNFYRARLELQRLTGQKLGDLYFYDEGNPVPTVVSEGTMLQGFVHDGDKVCKP